MRWLHRFADARLREYNTALRVERRKLRKQNRELRDANHTLSYVAANRTARIGRLMRDLAEAQTALREQGETK